MTIIIKEIQAIVNNRPLTYVSSDMDDLQVLSPSHLIYGKQIDLVATEEIDNSQFDPSCMGKEHLEKMAFRRAQLIQNFRSRFQNEYLATLRQRHAHVLKKQGISDDIIQVGDVVTIHSKDHPRRDWKLGVIQELLRGSDGLTRTALVKTNYGVSSRPVAKLYPLELNIGQCVQTPKKMDININATVRSKRKAAVTARQKIQSQLAHITGEMF